MASIEKMSPKQYAAVKRDSLSDSVVPEESRQMTLKDLQRHIGEWAAMTPDPELAHNLRRLLRDPSPAADRPVENGGLTSVQAGEGYRDHRSKDASVENSELTETQKLKAYALSGDYSEAGALLGHLLSAEPATQVENSELREALDELGAAVRMQNSSLRDDLNDSYDDDYTTARSRIEELFASREQAHAFDSKYWKDEFLKFRAEISRLRSDRKVPDIEVLAEAVHEAYLDTCGRLGWPVKSENRVPYARLSDDGKELDRASVRAVLRRISGSGSQ